MMLFHQKSVYWRYYRGFLFFRFSCHTVSFLGQTHWGSSSPAGVAHHLRHVSGSHFALFPPNACFLTNLVNFALWLQTKKFCVHSPGLCFFKWSTANPWTFLTSTWKLDLFQWDCFSICQIIDKWVWPPRFWATAWPQPSAGSVLCRAARHHWESPCGTTAWLRPLATGVQRWW